MKIALYEYARAEGRNNSPYEVVTWMEAKDSSYIRVSDIHEINFNTFDDSRIIPQKVKALKAKKAIQNAEIDEQISKLMAITHQPEEAS